MVVTIMRWTGREARLLREAGLRMSIRDFATHTNLSTYAIRDFETKGGQANLRISTQKILDDTLAGAPEDAKERFAAALRSSSGDRHDHQLSANRDEPLNAGVLPRPRAVLASQPEGADGTETDWAAWFGIRVGRLISLIDDWRESITEPAATERVQTLLHQEILMFDASAPGEQPLSQPPYAFPRRQALMTLAALPLALGSSIRSQPAAVDSFLSRCALSLAASWHLLRGSDLHVVHQVISPYLLKLEGIAQRFPAYQEAAARLASQAHRIMGIVALHQSHLKAREHHCKQALRLAKLTSDVGSRVSALVSLASTYFYVADPAKAAATYEQVLPLGAAVTPLQRSRVYAELAVVYGQLGREHDALRSLEEAEQLYPDQPEEDPSFLYAEFTRASLTLELGLAYLAMAERNPGRRYPERAAAIFASLDRSHDSDSTPDRIRFEVTNHQANAATMLNDLDAFEFYVAQALAGVSQLRSQQRQRELQQIWRRASGAWEGEPRFRELGERLQVAMKGMTVSIEAQAGRS